MSYNGAGGHWELGRDIMQVCLNGHVINDEVGNELGRNKNFCDICGIKTVTSCAECQCPIPGTLRDSLGIAGSGLRRSAPDFCQYCGEPFPWTGKKEAKQLEAEAEKPIEVLARICSKFHLIARKLRNRHDNRTPLDVADEYDVQDLLLALLVLYFDDIRPEEWTPNYAGQSARMDFLLKKEKIVVEVKMTRKGLADKEIGNQLIVDIERYKEHLDCDTLVCFIYDPEGRITNPQGLKGDLQSQSKDNLKVLARINPL